MGSLYYIYSITLLINKLCSLTMWSAMYFLFAFIIFFSLLNDTRKPKGYPPGPRWLPLIGNFMEFKRLYKKLRYTHLVWQHWSRKYGPLFGIRLGLDKIVIVSDYKTAREVLSRDEFEGRPDGFLFRMRSFGKRLGVVFNDGYPGQDQRTFCLKHLKEFGFGRTSMELAITEEINELITFLKDKCQEGPVNLYNLLNVHILNRLWAMTAGKRFSPMDSKLSLLLDYVHASFHMQDMSGGILNQIPFIRFFGAGRRMYKLNIEILNNLLSFLKETVEEHKNSIKQNLTRDLIDAFLHESEREETNRNNFNEEQLLVLLMDLFMAGADTTTNTVAFLILLLIKYPEIQKKAQQELDEVFGDNSVPELQDRNRLNYFEALLMEVQRFCNIAPTTIPHRAKESVKLRGYLIPQDTTIIVSLYNIHMDKEHWGDPEVFRPERFLDSLSGNVKNDEHLIPFGLGRRRCLGETLAKASVFKYAAALVKTFTFSSPPGKAISINPIDGAILFPAPFSVILTPRGWRRT